MSGEKLALTTNRRKEIPGYSPADERFLDMVVALTGELTIARERIDTLERLIEAAGVVKRADVESFEPTEAQAKERAAIRKRIIAKALRPIAVSAEKDLASALANRSTGTSDQE